jgi:hypothetical protein
MVAKDCQSTVIEVINPTAPKGLEEKEMKIKELRAAAASVIGALSAGITTAALSDAPALLERAEKELEKMDAHLGVHSTAAELRRIDAFSEAVAELRDALGVPAPAPAPEPAPAPAPEPAPAPAPEPEGTPVLEFQSNIGFVPMLEIVVYTTETSFSAHHPLGCDGSRAEAKTVLLDEADPRYEEIQAEAQRLNKAAVQIPAVVRQAMGGDDAIAVAAKRRYRSEDAHKIVRVAQYGSAALWNAADFQDCVDVAQFTESQFQAAISEISSLMEISEEELVADEFERAAKVAPEFGSWLNARCYDWKQSYVPQLGRLDAALMFPDAASSVRALLGRFVELPVMIGQVSI